MTKYTVAIALENRKAFQRWLAVKDDGIVGPATLAAFDTRMVNLCAVAVTGDDIKRFASDLSVSTKQVAAVATVESAGGGYDKQGRPKILYESRQPKQSFVRWAAVSVPAYQAGMAVG